MPGFDYKAIDKKTGKEMQSSVQADSEMHAKALLRSKNLLVTEIKSAHNAQLEQIKSGWFKHKIKIQKLMLFTRQLATLLSSGMEVDAALKLIADQADSKEIKKMTVLIRNNLAEGMTLSQAMQMSGTKFPNDYLATIAAGEETGHMITVMDRLADEVEHLAKTMQGLMSALIYPAVMITASLAIVTLLMIYVVPKITEIFVDMKQQLPTITVILIAMSNFLIDKGIYLLLAITAGISFFIFRIKTSKSFNLAVHKKLLVMPVFGPLLLATQIGRWSRSFGMLLSSGVPTLQALRIAMQTITNKYLYQTMNEINDKVREGQALHIALQSSKIIPSFVVHMSSSGEASGNLDVMMLKISDYYVQFVRLTTETTMKLFEPVLIIVMGGVVLIIVLAVLLPIFELNTLV